MSPLFKRLTGAKAKDSPSASKSRRGGKPAETGPVIGTRQFVETGLFLAFFALVTLICFLGQTPSGPAFIPNHQAPTRLVAEFPFSYESRVRAEALMEETRAQVPPVFERSFKPFDAFSTLINELNTSFARSQIDHEEDGEEAVRSAFKETAGELIAATGFDVDIDAVVEFVREASPKKRSDLFSDALGILREIYADGIYPVGRADGAAGAAVSVIQIVDEEGRASLPDARSLAEAAVALRVRLNALSADAATAQALYEIFRSGLRANLVYSRQGTERAVTRAAAEVTPPLVVFKEGETVIEPGTRIGPLEMERLNAYEKAEKARGHGALFLNELFLQRAVLTLALLVAVLVYLQQGLRNLHKRDRAITITAVAILLSLAVIRLVTEVGEIALPDGRGGAQILPFAAPIALAPIIVAVLAGPGPAVLAALIVSVLFGIMQDNSMEFLLAAFLAGVVGSYASVNVRKRARLVRAGLLSGAMAAIAAIAFGLFHHLSLPLLGQQLFIALATGLLTGIVVVGLIPVFEQLFNITTEITLLELTDYNHPLLRRMQLEAPGSYHHSLMVSNLSENAAAAIGASPLLCRVCSLFHDIGKLVKPEYFIENQRDGINPHAEKNPSMSALVIKAHVKEGVELARKNRLPRVITDVIRQHHGTTLIQYFYFEARKRKESETAPPFPLGNGGATRISVDEGTYRYDGPKPAFKESAIIFFADSVEAASRTLRKVSQPAIDELIETLFKDRIDDGQLEECPLTFKELAEIRRSFSFTLLNMLHSRVEYPKDKEDKEGKEGKETDPKNKDSSREKPDEETPETESSPACDAGPISGDQPPV